MLFVQALILFHWKGNLTHESITMKVFSDNKTSNLYLYNNEISREIELDKQSYPIIIQLQDLKPQTTYYYYFDNSQRTQLKPYDFDNQNGFFQFTTFGLPFQPFSFNFSVSACARTQSTSRVFYDIHQDHPSFFLQLGDLHYSNIKVPSFDDFDFAYKQVFASTTQRYLQMQYSYLRYQQTPIEYQFDDHDYGANDADSTSPTREVANLIYWRYVPHANHHNTMPFFNVSGISEIDQISQITEENIGTFRYRIIGRTILIVLDLRTFSNAKTMLGDKQKLWLYSLLESLKTQINIKAIILASSVNFHGQSWYEYPNEQYQVADYLSDLQQNYDKKVLIVSSDSHSTGFYNGNGLFIGNLSSKYNKGIIEAMSGSLDKPGSCKFRKVTFGPWLGPGHFTNVKVIDDGVNVYFFITAYKGREILYTFNQSDRGSQDIQSDNDCPMTPLQVLAWTVIMLVVSIVGVGLILLMVNFIHNRRMRITMDLEKSKQLK